MELVRPGMNIDFVGKRNWAYSVSLLMIVVTIVLFIWRGGPNYGVDFAGGTVVQFKLGKKQAVSEIREALNRFYIEGTHIQEFEEEGQAEYLIRIGKGSEVAGIGEKVEEALEAAFGKGGLEIRRVESVGPQVSEDLREKALFAIFYSILFMAVYISGRFEMKWTMSVVMALSLCAVTYAALRMGMSVTWLIVIALLVTLILCWLLNLKYALGAIIALIHDVAITLGAFALTDREFSLTTIAALLTIVGYSLNDTIIIFDRIRENLRRTRRQNLAKLINDSVNQTLSRTLITSGTTLIVVVALFIFGGNVIHDFAFALMVGFVVGTYSTIYVASPILLLFEKKKQMAETLK
ncbi:MAG: protein translocase subunit SecF [Deltaproteobacteria bacterium]|nr:protein translocase subunit SecF [Deltaproteobacteria bacterium]